MADKRQLHVGDRIEAKDHGAEGSKKAWIKGTITAVNSDGTYEVIYDGVSLPKSDIRPAENPFRVEDTVAVSFRGKVAKINSDGTIDVKLGDNHVVKSVNPKHVHSMSGNVDMSTLAAGGGKSQPKEHHEPKFAEGDKVECDYKGKGKWYNARISKVRKDGHYDVIYDDGDQEQNLPEAKIREVPSQKDKEPQLAVGTKIEARLKGKSRWFPGSIIATHDNETYDIEYEDGEKEKNVAKNLIRIPRRTSFSGVSTPVFEEGERVEANYKDKGKWYPGTIAKVHADGTLDIDYDDGEKEKKVDTKLVRKLPMDAVKENLNEDTRSEGGNAGSSEKGKIEFKDGEKIEANYKGKGKWHAGKIGKVRKDGYYDIHYDDGDKEEKVSAEHIRHLPDINEPIEEDSKTPSKDDKKESQSGKKAAEPEMSERDRKKMEKEEKEAKFRSLLKVGSVIEGNYKDKGKWYPGKISKIRTDGTYLIAYDDGEEENFVYLECIRFPEGSAEAKALESPETSDTAKKTAMLAIGKAVKTAAASVTTDDKKGSGDSGKNPKADDDAPKFVKGDKVEADYKGKGKWFPGTVTQTRAGGAACDILYDDGETEMTVPASRIRPREGEAPKKPAATVDDDEEPEKPKGKSKAKEEDEAPKFAKDDKIEADYKGKGKWYPGKIIAVKNDGAAFDILYDDGEKELGVPASRLRYKEGEAPKKPAAAAAAAVDDEEAEKPKAKESAKEKSKAKEEDEAPKFAKDDKVEADYKGKGKWYPGKIISVKNDGAAFDILYDDGEKELGVPASRLRYKEGEAPKKPAAAAAAAVDDDEEAEEPKGKSKAKEEDEAPKFAKDDKVEADYKGKGKWYPGKITQVKAGGAAFDVLYDDGEKELGVPTSRLRFKEGDAPKKSTTAPAAAGGGSGSPSKGAATKAAAAAESSGFRVNDKVSVDYKGKGKFYPGKIAKDKGNGNYDIHYDDGEKELDVPAARIKSLGDDKQKPKVDTAAAADDEEFDHDSATTPRRPQQEKPSITSTRAAQAVSPSKAGSGREKDRDEPPADTKKAAGGVPESKSPAAAVNNKSPAKKSPAAAADDISKFLRESCGMAAGAAKKTADAAVARDITTLSQLQSTLKSRNFAFETLHLTKSVADRIVAAISKEER